MSVFNIDDPIDIQWLYDNDFYQSIMDLQLGPHGFTKILRPCYPFIYITYDSMTHITIIHYVTKFTFKAGSIIAGKITDRIEMLGLIDKYSKEDCLS